MSWLHVCLASTFVAVAIGSWMVFGVGARSLSGAPSADVQALSWGWRMGWPLVARLAPVVAVFVGPGQRERLRQSLARAGLDARLRAEHLVAAQLVAAGALSLAAAAVLAVLGTGSASLPVVAAALGAALPRIALRDRIQRRRRAILRQLPHDLDLVSLSVEAGLNLGAALAHAAANGASGALGDEWQRVLRDVRAGQPRHEALRAMSTRLGLPAVSNVVAALIAAERQGASLAPILRAQAEQRRTERFLRAEKLAMEAPVKMLLPLVLFIFPGTFAILLFPIAQRLLVEGML